MLFSRKESLSLCEIGKRPNGNWSSRWGAFVYIRGAFMYMK